MADEIPDHDLQLDAPLRRAAPRAPRISQYAYLRDPYYESDEYKQLQRQRARDWADIRAGKLDDDEHLNSTNTSASTIGAIWLEGNCFDD